MDIPYRLIAVDVDGTLVDSRGQVPTANRRALHRAHEAGMKVCICTGRSLSETRAVIEAVGLDSDAGVFIFGAVVSALPEGRTLRRTAMERPLAARLTEFFQDRGYPLLVAYDGWENPAEFCLIRGERLSEGVERWRSNTPTPVREYGHWRELPPEPVRIGVLDEPGHIEETLAVLNAEFPAGQMKCNAIYAPNYGLHVVECFAPRVNKWYGITMLAEPLGIRPEQIVAIGDDVNDLEMIREAGLGIAMGNANPKVAAVARRQTRGHDEGGVAVAVEAILDGELGRLLRHST